MSDDPDIGDMLDQGDIDALMREAEADTENFGVIFNSDGDRYPPESEVKVSICDFRNPVFLTESEMRQVRIRHESFIHYMSARLSMFIRMDVSLKMSKLHTLSYEEFTETIPSPTFINLFRVTGLNGVGVISVNPRLAMTLVNRMLGGKGHSVSDERFLTDIEMALMEDAVRLMLDEWCNQWQETDGLHATISGRENNGRFLQTSASDAIMLVLDVEAALGDCCEQIQLGIPYYMIDPMIKKMKESEEESSGDSGKEKESKWLPNYSDIHVPTVAEWDAFEVPVCDLLRLKEGDVLQMPKDMIKETKVRINKATRFVGEVGVEDGHVAVKVIDKLEDES